MLTNQSDLDLASNVTKRSTSYLSLDVDMENGPVELQLVLRAISSQSDLDLVLKISKVNIKLIWDINVDNIPVEFQIKNAAIIL